MADFNLIPERYILWRKFVSDLRFFLIFLTVLVLLGIVGRVLLQRDIKHQANTISELRENKAFIDNQHAEIRDLLDNKSTLETRFKLVNGLKGSLSASDLFLAMDRSLSEDIEFESWRFQRTGQAAKQDEKDRASSYFIIVEDLADSDSEFDGVRIKSEINLVARARSHSAMADFMRKLTSQSIVAGVELLHSGSHHGGLQGAVEFEFLVELNSETKSL